MTLGMLFYALLWFACGGVVGYELGKQFGILGYICGVLIGTGSCYIFTWAITVGRLRLFYPLPLCRCGKCQDYNDYDWPLGTVYGREWGGIYRYRCHCQKDEYVRKGSKFMIVLRDGTTKPFMKLASFRTWVEDKP